MALPDACPKRLQYCASEYSLRIYAACKSVKALLCQYNVSRPGRTGAGTAGPGAGAAPPAPAKEVMGAPLALMYGMDEFEGVSPVRPGLPGLIILQQGRQSNTPWALFAGMMRGLHAMLNGRAVARDPPPPGDPNVAGQTFMQLLCDIML